jgi:hypothetical protein
MRFFTCFGRIWPSSGCFYMYINPGFYIIIPYTSQLTGVNVHVKTAWWWSYTTETCCEKSCINKYTRKLWRRTYNLLVFQYTIWRSNFIFMSKYCSVPNKWFCAIKWILIKCQSWSQIVCHVHQLRIIGIISNFVLKMYVPEGSGFLLHICFRSRITRLIIKNGERDDILRYFGCETQLFYRRIKESI